MRTREHHLLKYVRLSFFVARRQVDTVCTFCHGVYSTTIPGTWLCAARSSLCQKMRWSRVHASSCIPPRSRGIVSHIQNTQTSLLLRPYLHLLTSPLLLLPGPPVPGLRTLQRVLASQGVVISEFQVEISGPPTDSRSARYNRRPNRMSTLPLPYPPISCSTSSLKSSELSRPLPSQSPRGKMWEKPKSAAEGPPEGFVVLAQMQILQSKVYVLILCRSHRSYSSLAFRSRIYARYGAVPSVCDLASASATITA